MALDISVPAQELVLLTPKITVIGVGGAGGNAINNMIQSHLGGVNFVVANTDAQALNSSLAETKIQLGIETTKGHGAGARPEVGRESAEEAIDEINSALEGANMVFITAGMGGGTGTGAAPVVAKMARERDILTVGVVTKPFSFEGRHRMAIAEQGIEDLSQYVDTLIVIPNQNLFLVADEKMTFAEAFKKADQVLQGGVRSITDLIITPGIINLDFSDVRAIMSEMGRAMMGTGVASGENRALDAAEEAIANPLLDDASMNGAKGILINIAGGADLTLFEVDAAANRIRQEVDPEANIIFGASFDESLEGSVRVSVVATGISRQQEPQNSFMTSKPATSSSIFSQTQPAPSFTPSFQTSRLSMPSSVEKPASVSSLPSSAVPTFSQPKKDMPEKEDVVTEDEDILDLDDISAAPSSASAIRSELKTQPVSFSPKNTGSDISSDNSSSLSSILPAMPSPSELFGTGEPKPSVSFDPFAQKSALTEKPQPSIFMPDSRPSPEEKTELAASQKDLFTQQAPSVSPVIPPPVKPVEKSRPSLFQFVTGRKSAEDKKADISDDDESELPSFLRQR